MASRRWTHIALLLWGVITLLPAIRILGDLPIAGNDHASHMLGVKCLAELLRAGKTDLFCATPNLGIPLYLYYQPLPHLAAALVHLVSFGWLGEQAAFNLTIVLLLGACPLAVYTGAVRLGLGSGAALTCALLAPLVSSAMRFGYTTDSVIGLGLYSQLYAMVLLPLCLGWLWQAVHLAPRLTRRTALIGGGLLALLWLSHLFYGLVAVTALALMVLVEPSRIGRRALRCVVVGGIAGLSLLFWLLPLMLWRDYMGSWFGQKALHWDGVGALAMLRDLFGGRLFDHGRFSLITCGLAFGAVLCMQRFRRVRVARFLLLGFALFAFFVMGRPTFGHLVDIQPLNLVVPLQRYIGPLQLFGVLLAGTGLWWLFARLRPALGRVPLAALILVLALPAVLMHQQKVWPRFTTNERHRVSDRDLRGVSAAIARSVASRGQPGRVYAHPRTGMRGPLATTALGTYTDQPLTAVYGFGMQDSLATFYLHRLDPHSADALALYNVRFVLADARSPFARARQREGHAPLFRRGALRLYRMPGNYGYFQAGSLDLSIFAQPRQARDAVSRWLLSSRAATHRFGVIGPRDKDSPIGKATGSPRAAAAPSTPSGQVLTETIGTGEYAARVQMERAGALALKVAYHPLWRVTVDGEPAPTLHLTPSFVGVQLPPGQHRAVFQFRNPLWQKALLALTLGFWSVALLMMIVAWVRRQRVRACYNPLGST